MDADDSDPADVGLARAVSQDPTDAIESAIDLVGWLDGLALEDGRMLGLRAAGYTLNETAEELGVSTSTVFARCRALGFELAERMGTTISRRAVISKVPAESGKPRRSPRSCASASPIRLTA